MAIIGTLNATNNGYEGHIETLTLTGRIAIESSRKSSDNLPVYRVFLIAEQFKTDIGAALEEASRVQTEYLSVSLDDITFPSKAYCRLVKTGVEKGHTLFWGASASRSRAGLTVRDGMSPDSVHVLVHVGFRRYCHLLQHPAKSKWPAGLSVCACYANPCCNLQLTAAI